MLAISDNRLPDAEASVESQMEYKKLRDKGLYEPLLGGPETQKELADKTQKGAMELADKNIKSQEKMGREKAKEAAKAPKLTVPSPTGGGPVGRPAGVSTPQPSDRKPGKIGEKQSRATFSLDKVKNNMVLANKLEEKIGAELKKKFKLKKLDDLQIEVVENIAQLVITNEDSKNWNKITYIRKYIKNPKDTNKEAANAIDEIACEHQVDSYLAGILHASRSEVDPCQE
jgi:bifunctional DNA-binding transcriptional regulator/antitoxin component of YhaV-PrlF toxin-antitoxin module